MGSIEQIYFDKAMPQFDWKEITGLFWLGCDSCIWKIAENRRVLVESLNRCDGMEWKESSVCFVWKETKWI